MTRLTRSQVQARNRRTLLRAAREAFLRDGYLATSLASVAREAGFTTGIVYSSFGSKADLALEVLQGLQSEQIASLGAHVKGTGGADELLGHVRTWARDAADSGWVRLELEVLLDSIGDERLSAAQTARQHSAIVELGAVFRTLAPADVLDDDLVSVLAEAAVDYAIGVGMRQVVNRDASPDRFLDLVAPLMRLPRG